MRIKVLTLTEPWASLVAYGIKTIETRSWQTTYTGPLAIQAAKSMPPYAVETVYDERFYGPLAEIAGLVPLEWPPQNAIRAMFPLGKIVAVCELTMCFEFNSVNKFCIPDSERPYGDFTYGRYGFQLANVRRLATPIPVRGYQRLWNYDLPEGVQYV